MIVKNLLIVTIRLDPADRADSARALSLSYLVLPRNRPRPRRAFISVFSPARSSSHSTNGSLGEHLGSWTLNVLDFADDLHLASAIPAQRFANLKESGEEGHVPREPI